MESGDRGNMKMIMILLILVSCGKEPGKSNNAKTDKLTIQTPDGPIEVPAEPPVDPIVIIPPDPSVEMVTVDCEIQRACQTACINAFIACVEPCGGQDATYQQFQQNPGWDKCQNDCNAESQICYKKKIQIPKEEYDYIMSH